MAATLEIALTPLKEKMSDKKYLARGAVFFGTYLIAAQIGFELFATTSPVIVSVAAGLSLGLLTVWGIRLWPTMFLGAFVIYLLNGASLLLTTMLAVATTLQAVTGAYLLKQLNFNPLFKRLHDGVVFLFVALVASTITPALGMIAQHLNDLFYAVPISPITWRTWWVGMIASLLTVSPFVIRWVGKPRLDPRSRNYLIETFIALTALLGINYLLFWTTVGNIGGVSLVYLLLVPLFWIALRSGPRFMTLALFLTGVTAITGILFSPAVPAPENLELRLFQLELFISIISIIFIILVTTEEERKNNIKVLHDSVVGLEDTVVRLDSQDNAKNEFIAMLAHELRNPLAPILSATEFLKFKGSNDPSKREAFKIIDDQVACMRRLLDDLLEVSRIARNQLSLAKEPSDLRFVIQRAVDSMGKIIEQKGQTFTVDISRHALFADIDPTRIEQVCINLLGNATKFTPTEGTITLTLSREGDEAVLRVRDTGAGIEASEQKHIFEPFLQGTSGHRSKEGVGLGLSLSKQLVELHNGTISVNSFGKGHGSEFTVRLPLLSTPTLPSSTPLHEESEDIPEIAGHSSTLRILVIDDNAVAAQGMVTLLQLKGYVVQSAYSGSEGKEKIASFKPDVLLLDIGLPDTDGYAVARDARELGFAGTIVALTGFGQEDDKEKARQAGFDHHLTKPAAIAEIEKILGGVSRA